MQPVLTGPVAGGSSIRKGGATATAVRSKSVRLGPVSGLFPVHATGPLNTNQSSQSAPETLIYVLQNNGVDLLQSIKDCYKNDPLFKPVLDKPKEFRNFEMRDGLIFLKSNGKYLLCFQKH